MSQESEGRRKPEGYASFGRGTARVRPEHAGEFQENPCVPLTSSSDVI